MFVGFPMVGVGQLRVPSCVSGSGIAKPSENLKTTKPKNCDPLGPAVIDSRPFGSEAFGFVVLWVVFGWLLLVSFGCPLVVWVTALRKSLENLKTTENTNTCDIRGPGIIDSRPVASEVLNFCVV